ncbi:efflux RND transporter periplasmic adaptor subunit [Aetokthonos hydrillicola Thurmond2011]|uniref:Efflux RND transporter periplasmic adaptor subunit n=1 Tax=Aetokthonos hydrillicola Thurmond2011 TaxID=2712845 RepID=A0AAP5IDG4_9CYAN|nr:efflux RND transporter periplasmic adaptor subunit [Aetokthonos hydrillicola]MBO3459178.1 efflux RND transporter periplasmic adaptor subunit [Aetokthonos hydrillicola CCALA 1050]MBW4584137.1 efflux RND transporter periplasmic adaptor subunit [Aetokthonos hydrillicola CCALA 1050]MDR9898329.1 efflux RND transporter periplasmic adaptor subunit [Aetokthonos hydrillicola Thurmond2011]
MKPTIAKKIYLEEAPNLEENSTSVQLPAKKKRSWVPILVSMGVISLGSLLLYTIANSKHKTTTITTPHQTNPVLTVTVQPVRVKTFTKKLVVTGSLAAEDDLPLGAELSGLSTLRIEHIYVDEGDWVHKGQVLAELDNRVILAQLHQAQANVKRSHSIIYQQKAVLQEALAQQQDADANVRRYNELLSQGAISRQEAQTRQTNAMTSQAKAESARHSIAVAQNDLIKAQAELESAQASLAQTQIVAPVDGYISKRQAKLGSIIPPTGSSALFNLVRSGHVELNAEVSELNLPNIKLNQQVLVTSETDTTKKYLGKVRKISSIVNPQTRLASVYIALPPKPELKPGMFMQGELLLGSSQTLVVPEAAVLFKNNKPFVFVLQGERVAARSIETGTRNQGLVEVRSGLKMNEPIVATGVGFLKDGDRVRVVSWSQVGGTEK